MDVGVFSLPKEHSALQLVARLPTITAINSVQVLLILTITLFLFRLRAALKANDTDQPREIPGLSVLAIYPFFRRRYDFLNWGFQATGRPYYRFNLLTETVICLSGERARKAFLTTKGLDLTEGFKVLSGAIPMVRGVTSDLQTQRIALIHKRLASVQKTERLARLLPNLVEDCRSVMQRWGQCGTFDPFTKIYELTFQTTVRSISCQEIAENPQLVSKLKLLYDDLDSGTTPATVLLPWLPTPAMLKKIWSTKKIYDIIVEAIAVREQSRNPCEDTLQFLLDAGDDKLVVVGFIIGLLVAGARATGTTASWLVTYLGAHPTWCEKAREEVLALLLSNSSSTSCHEPLSRSLATIPLEAWEDQTPILDLIIKETLRVAQPHTAMRRNLGPDVYIDGIKVPSGAYVVYPFSDVHLDSDLYADPWTWDPSRPEPKESVFGSIQWGAGKTVCLGQRLARLELKIMTSMFLLGFQHSVVDMHGRAWESSLTPNWNDILLCRPTAPCYVKYERTNREL